MGQDPVAAAAEIAAIQSQIDGGVETHLYLTDYRSLYVGQLGEVTADAVLDCLRDLVRRLLESSFPESLHEEIAAAVGLELAYQSRQARDHRFRDRVLVAYGYSCAVCGYNLRLHHAPVALEAAHIKWHQAGGPSTEDKGARAPGG